MAFVKSGRKEEILDSCIEELKKRINVKEAQRYLFATPIKEPDNRPPLHGHDLADLYELSRAKLEKIEEILTLRLKNPNAVFEEIKRIIKVCNAQPLRQNFILDIELNSLGGTQQTNNQHEK
jgi:hypothetical protein